MVSTRVKVENTATPWWAAILAPLFGVPLLVALLALTVHMHGATATSLDVESTGAPVVEFVEAGEADPVARDVVECPEEGTDVASPGPRGNSKSERQRHNQPLRSV